MTGGLLGGPESPLPAIPTKNSVCSGNRSEIYSK